MKKLTRADIDKYMDEDVSNISKEDTPIVRALDRRQSVSFVVAFLMVCAVFAVAMYHDEIGRTPATVIAVILTIGIIVFIVDSIRTSIKVDKIKKWQKHELYRSILNQQAYGKPLSEIKGLDPARTVLLMIDMQKAFVEPGAALCIKGAKSTVPACEAALEDARALGIKVIWIKREYSEDGSDMEIPRREMLEEQGITGVLAPGLTGVNSAEEPDGLTRLDGEEVIIKPRWSAFFGTNLNAVLQSDGIENVILAGTTTPNCIRTTCYDAIAYDYRTIILARCTSSETEEIQQSNLEDMRRAGAEII